MTSISHLPSSGSGVLRKPQTDSQTSQTSRVPAPRYEEEEEEEEEDEDCYAPELPPELAATRASGASGPPRRTLGPARGPLRREEEEEESEDEIGPLPPHVGVGPDAREDAVAEFMQKEAQRRQAVEVRYCYLAARMQANARQALRVVHTN